MRKLIYLIIALAGTLHFSAQEGVVYKASLFGCISDGVTLNTNSIQAAVNLISEKGGGSLHFYVGRYLTGTIHLKDNVTIVLHEGATFVGTSSIYDYDRPSHDVPPALIIAEGRRNIGVIGASAETPSVPPAKEPEITGAGILQGNAAKLRQSIAGQEQQGYLKSGNQPPALISFSNCEGVKIEGLMLLDAAGDVQVYRNCRNVSVANLIVNSRETPGCAGIVLGGCNGVSVQNSFFDVSGKPLRTTGNSGRIRTSGNRTPTGVL